MLDEAVDGIGPTPDVGDIMANRFGPNASRERALTGGNKRLMREYGCSLCQCIPKDVLDVIG